MLNILINAYAVSPNWGSEPGMGWNWVTNLSRYCNLYVITEGEWKKEIEQAIKAGLNNNFDEKVNPTKINKEQAEHLHFYYLPVSDEVRTKCWNQGTWSFYYHYYQWQKRSLALAKEIASKYKIDILHQLNMICYREPGLVWKIEDIPFVWGPVGGVETYPIRFLKGEPLTFKTKIAIKNTLLNLMFRYQGRVKACMNRSNVVVAATKEMYEKTVALYRDDVVLINETGCLISEEIKPHISDSREFKLLWVGKYDSRKQLGIAINTMNILKNRPNIKLFVVGSGYEEDIAKYTMMVKELGLLNTVKLLGKISNVEVRKMMQDSDLFFFTSVDEATSTVVPEAIASGLPVICHDIDGFGPLIDKSIGRKIEVKSPDNSSAEFAKIVSELEENRQEVRRMSARCLEKRYEISWEANAKKMVKQYEIALGKKRV